MNLTNINDLTAQRNIEIAIKIVNGEKHIPIAKMYNISKGRVGQITYTYRTFLNKALAGYDRPLLSCLKGNVRAVELIKAYPSRCYADKNKANKEIDAMINKIKETKERLSIDGCIGSLY